MTTPILISHGDRDPRVPLATAQKFFRALQALGKTVEMDIYPGGGHVLSAAARTRGDDAQLRVDAKVATAALISAQLARSIPLSPGWRPTPLSRIEMHINVRP